MALELLQPPGQSDDLNSSTYVGHRELLIYPAKECLTMAPVVAGQYRKHLRHKEKSEQTYLQNVVKRRVIDDHYLSLRFHVIALCENVDKPVVDLELWNKRAIKDYLSMSAIEPRTYVETDPETSTDRK
uniref:Uncharacterized protein n=1 Tax=Glossina palpalis gambiensis TaxID=67801 RepID=A0A1B0B2Q3_9MUSC